MHQAVYMKQADVPRQANRSATTAAVAAAKPFWDKCVAAAEEMKEQAAAAAVHQVEIQQLCDEPCPTFHCHPTQLFYTSKDLLLSQKSTLDM